MLKMSSQRHSRHRLPLTMIRKENLYGILE